MKLFITLLLAVGFFSNLSAKGIPIPVCFPCEELTTVEELPASEDLLGEFDEKLNLGYLYEAYGALWIPVWNQEGQYVLVNEAEDTYYEVEADYIAELQELHGFEVPSGSPLSLWKKVGGKVILVFVLGLIVWGQFGSSDEDENVPA